MRDDSPGNEAGIKGAEDGSFSTNLEKSREILSVFSERDGGGCV